MVGGALVCVFVLGGPLASHARVRSLPLARAQLPTSPEDQERQVAEREAAEERRRAILSTVLEPSARERLTRIALVRPEKARSVEDMIINAARRGQLKHKVSEDHLIELLEQVSGASRQTTTVTIQRRRGIDDEF